MSLSDTNEARLKLRLLERKKRSAAPGRADVQQETTAKDAYKKSKDTLPRGKRLLHQATDFLIICLMLMSGVFFPHAVTGQLGVMTAFHAAEGAGIVNMALVLWAVGMPTCLVGIRLEAYTTWTTSVQVTALEDAINSRNAMLTSLISNFTTELGGVDLSIGGKHLGQMNLTAMLMKTNVLANIQLQALTGTTYQFLLVWGPALLSYSKQIWDLVSDLAAPVPFRPYYDDMTPQEMKWLVHVLSLTWLLDGTLGGSPIMATLVSYRLARPWLASSHFSFIMMIIWTCIPTRFKHARIILLAFVRLFQLLVYVLQSGYGFQKIFAQKFGA